MTARNECVIINRYSLEKPESTSSKLTIYAPLERKVAARKVKGYTMNEKTYIKKLRNNADFLEDEVFYVNLEEISYDKHEEKNAVRSSSHKPGVLEKMKASIRNNGVIVPIDASRGCNGKWTGHDGFGRTGRAKSVVEDNIALIALIDDVLAGKKVLQSKGDETTQKFSKEDVRKVLKLSPGHLHEFRSKLVEEVERCSSIPVYPKKYENQAKRLAGMLFENIDRLPHDGGTLDDVAATAHRLLIDHSVCGTDTSDMTVPFIKSWLAAPTGEGPDGLRDGLGLGDIYNGNQLNSIAQRTYNKLPYESVKFRNYVTDKDAIEEFNRLNDMGIKIPVPLNSEGKYAGGEVVEDKDGQLWAVYTCKQSTYAAQNIAHYSLKKKDKYEKLGNDVKVLLLCWNGTNLSGKSMGNCPVESFRKAVRKEVRNWDEMPSLQKANLTIVDKTLFLPQINRVETVLIS